MLVTRPGEGGFQGTCSVSRESWADGGVCCVVSTGFTRSLRPKKTAATRWEEEKVSVPWSAAVALGAERPLTGSQVGQAGLWHPLDATKPPR